MIRAVSSYSMQNRYGRRQIIRDSGYVAITAGALCGLTGLRKFRFPHKMTVHKNSAYIAIAASFLHLGAIKNWDKKLFG